MKQCIKKVLSAALALIVCMPMMVTGVTAEEAKTEVDIAFIIDSTGSMGDEISNVRTNLNEFTTVLDEAEIDFRISVVEYKDITVSGERESTIVRTYNGEEWFTTPENVESVLSQISVTGGGDGPETLVDALGCMMSDELDFRDGASKFAFVLTDADYKNDNDYGLADMADAIENLKTVGISTSVISSNSYKTLYNALYTETDGIFCDIYGNFAEELIELAEYIKRAVRPVTIDLSTTIGSIAEDGVFSGTIDVTITSTDDEETVENMTVTLNLPEGMTIPEDMVDLCPLQRTVSLAPGDSVYYMWVFNVPLMEENALYTFTVTADSDSFATGVVCKAQDTISVAGTDPTDYTYIYEEDNYSFTNSYGAFGSGEIYVDADDLAAYLDNFSNSELELTARWYAEDGTIENLRAGNLQNWGGSCYGMSLTSALYKAGINDVTEDWDVSNVYDLTMSSSSNSALESYINIYHMTQATASSRVSINADIDDPEFFDYVIQRMWNSALNIGVAGARQQPYLVSLFYRNPVTSDIEYGHAVVCFGTESGTFNYNDEDYSRRLRIYDPNSTKEEYIYIADDNSSAVLTSHNAYNIFGYWDVPLNQLNKYDFDDSEMNYTAKLSASEMTELAIESETGKAVIIAGKVVEGDLDIDTSRSVDGVADGEGTSPRFVYLLPENDASYSITPGEGEELNATLYYEAGSFGISGNADSVDFSADGKVTVNNAEGDIKVSLALNDSSLDFVEITGSGAGEITVCIQEDGIEISGDISGYTISHLSRDGAKDSIRIDDDIDVLVKAVTEDDTEEVVAYYDSDNDGTYDTIVEDDTDDEDTPRYRKFYFARLFNVNMTVGEGGRTNVSDSFAIAFGASRTIRITPDEGYEVADVVVNGRSVGAVEEFKITAANSNFTVDVTFAKVVEEAASVDAEQE